MQLMLTRKTEITTLHSIRIQVSCIEESDLPLGGLSVGETEWHMAVSMSWTVVVTSQHGLILSFLVKYMLPNISWWPRTFLFSLNM
jgi:hypothetical protein